MDSELDDGRERAAREQEYINSLEPTEATALRSALDKSQKQMTQETMETEVWSAEETQAMDKFLHHMEADIPK